VTDGASAGETAWSQEEIDALAYAYVLAHGYDGALAMLDELLAHHGQSRTAAADDLGGLCRRIAAAIHDEAATITRLLDRMVPALNKGAEHHGAAVPCPGPNLIDRHIGNRLRLCRSRLGLSLAALAAELGLSPEALALIEAGEDRPDAIALARAALFLDVPVTCFFQASRPHDDGVAGPLKPNKLMQSTEPAGAAPGPGDICSATRPGSPHRRRSPPSR
jgi:transcriptional regulator with XRE-family HTH domain